MAWVRIHDGALSHPKLAGLVKLHDPFTLWIWGLSYCQMHLTDGRIPFESLSKRVRKSVETLVKRGLWDVIPGFGWQVHDYLQWNNSKDFVREQQSRSREKQERFRNRLVTGSNPNQSKPIQDDLSSKGTEVIRRSSASQSETDISEKKKEAEMLDASVKRLAAKLIRELLKKNTYVYHGDLKHDLYRELRAAGVDTLGENGYIVPLAIDEAMSMIQSNTPLIRLPKPRTQ